MKHLKDLKPGDKVILIREDGRRTVEEVFSKRKFLDEEIVCVTIGKKSHDFDAVTGDSRDRWMDGKLVPATSGLIAEVEQENAEKKRLVDEEAARVAADPKTPLVTRFRAGDFEPWEKLSLEQLEQIRAWLDAVR